jgi:glutamyl/glutaminyl-tRNA synthetase
MNPEELKLFKEKEESTYKIKETGEAVTLDWLMKIISIYQKRLKKLSEISQLTDFFFKDKLEYEKDLLRWQKMTDKEIKFALDRLEKKLSKIKVEDFDKENLERVLFFEAEEFAKKLGKAGDRGYLLWPLRVALTGKEASAGPFEIAEILGKEKTIKRIKEAKKLLR